MSLTIIEDSDILQLRLADSLAQHTKSNVNTNVCDTLSFVASEMVTLCKLSLPIVISSVLQAAIELISVAAAGHLGVTELDGFGLGRVLGNSLGIAPLLGLIMAMDTLATQAHGATQLHLIGTLAQRASLIALLACIPIFVLWWNMGPILLLLGQDPEVVPRAIQFLRWLSPGVYPLLIFEIIKKYLQAQNIVYPIPFILIITLVFHAAVTYLLIWPCQLGFLSCPLAMSLSYTFMMTLGLLYIRFSAKYLPSFTPVDPMQCWGGWSCDAFHQWSTFLRIGVPSSFHLCLDFWSYDSMMLMAGMLGMTQLATANIIMQLIEFTFMAPLGISIAAAVRVGQRLGAGDSSSGRLTAWTAFAFVTAESIVNGLFTFFLLNTWAKMFTVDATVLKLIHQLPLLIAALIWVDGIQSGIVGILRGCGLQGWAAGIALFSQWLVGIPLAAIAAFHLRWGLLGLYGGQLCGSTLVSALYTILISCVNWPKVTTTARHRAGCRDEMQMVEIVDVGDALEDIQPSDVSDGSHPSNASDISQSSDVSDSSPSSL